MGRKIMILLVLCLLLSGGTGNFVKAQENQQESLQISQVQIMMPEVKVYLNENISEDTAQKTEAFLGTKELSYKDAQTTGEDSACYTILLDVSASISDEAFQRMKIEILEFIDTLRAEDTAAVFTFGDEVQCIERQDSNNQELESFIRDVGNKDQNTLLFEAVKDAAEWMEQKEEYGRNVMILLTDGEDFSLGTATRNEALDVLSQKGISVFSILPAEAAKEDINAMGEFSRNSGGDVKILQEEEKGTLQNLSGEILESTCIVYEADSNKISNEKETLVLNFPDTQGHISREVIVSDWIPDEVSPQIQSIQKKDDKTLRVLFSEEVKNAEKISSWKVTKDGENIPVESIRTVENSQDEVELIFSETLYQGDYQFETNQITDISQEENEIEDLFYLSLEGERKPWISKDKMLFLLCFCFVLLIAGIGIVLFILREKKIRKNKGIVYMDGKPIMVSQLEQHEKIPVEIRKGKDIALIVDAGGREVRKIETQIDGSLFIGRSPICNYYFEDSTLSRQHFVLEYEETGMYISDLNSKGGTKVNGIPIYRKYKLNESDIISAGQLRFRVKWRF